jgi:hypothetical protein
MWKFVDIGSGWFKILSKEGTVLDSFGKDNFGNAGIAGYMKDDGQNDNLHRKWRIKNI